MSRSDVRQTLTILLAFLSNPVREIGHLPDWSPRQTLITQAACAAVSGFLAGLLPFGLWKLLQGMILFPITFSVLMGLLACFFYYYFQIFEQRTVPFFRIYQFLFFAHLPYFIFHIGSSLFPLADVVGLALCALLMTVGLTANFGVDKRRSIKVVVVIFGALFLVWMAEKVSSMSQDRMASLSAPY